MKKSFSNVVFGGYYVSGMILGIALAIAMSVVMELTLVDWAYADGYLGGGRMQTFELLWGYLPLTICDWLWMMSPNYIAGKLVGMASTFLSVWLLVKITSSKNWRTKVLQALAWCLLGLLIPSAIRSTMSVITADTSWLPIAALAVIPMIILGKTRQAVQPVQGTRRLKAKLVKGETPVQANHEPLK